MKRQRGERTPEGWLIDHVGRPTTQFLMSFIKSPRGAILPLGGPAGHKGFGLAMVVEILSGIRRAAGFGGEGTQRFSNSTCIVVIDISAFVEPSEFHAEIDDL